MSSTKGTAALAGIYTEFLMRQSLKFMTIECLRSVYSIVIFYIFSTAARSIDSPLV